MHKANRTCLPPRFAWPALVWFLGFLVIPIGFVATYSFAQRGVYGNVVFEWGIQNYLRALDWLYLEIFWNSFKLAGATATVCLLLGYPMAYALATASAKLRPWLMGLVVLPFWTNFVIRVYSIKVLLSESGPFAGFAQAIGIQIDPGFLSQGTWAVAIGMITNYLPFMILPLYVVLEKFDFTLLEAARDLGASPLKVWLRVLIPLTQRGIFTGWLLVFTPALGEFVIPDLLGGARVMMVGNLIADQFLKTRDWPFGSTLSVILMFSVMASLFFYLKNRGEDHAGA
jgi:spermidine/putrescine transport system permease protein